jgi:hypothetical protein
MWWVMYVDVLVIEKALRFDNGQSPARYNAVFVHHMRGYSCCLGGSSLRLYLGL